MNIFRKILNLPEKEPKTSSGPDPGPDAGQRDPPPDAARPPADRGRPASAWDEEAESGARSAARRTGRAVIWCVIGLLAFAGLRSTVFPAKPARPATNTVQAASTANQVPVPQAQQVAAVFARSYLTFDASDPQQRQDELAAQLPSGADSKMGWNGAGAEQVSQAIPGAVQQLGGKRARVDVDVRVSVYTTVHGTQVVTNSWRALQVPVAEAGGRVIVTGQPALVGLPGPVSYTPPPQPDIDNAMSSSTSSTVHDFLVAWAAGEQAQTAAPGASIASLGGSITLASLDSWSVDAGSGAKRTGTASVTWNIAGAQVQQTYRITLLEVSAADASRWQVYAVTSS